MTFLFFLTSLSLFDPLGSLGAGRGFPQEGQGGQEGQGVPPLVVDLLRGR